MSLYDIKVTAINGQTVPLSTYEGKVLLIVNTASKCGFTPQYEGLQKLYQAYRDQGFAVLGFPCNQFMKQEPGDEAEIASFCDLNYGVTFPMFAKIDVNGPGAHPLYKYLTKAAPGFLGIKSVKWNFTKFLVDRNGTVLKRYAPKVTPDEIEGLILELLESAPA